MGLWALVAEGKAHGKRRAQSNRERLASRSKGISYNWLPAQPPVTLWPLARPFKGCVLVESRKVEIVVGENPLPGVWTSPGEPSRWLLNSLHLGKQNLTPGSFPTLALAKASVCLSSSLSVCLSVSGVVLSNLLVDFKWFLIPALPSSGIKYLASITSERLLLPKAFSSASSSKGEA